MANVDNSGAARVEFRQTWTWDVAPVGLTDPIVRMLRAPSTGFPLPQCHSTGTGGQILISSWDRTNPDITRQTLTSGYASYFGSTTLPPSVIQDGLCFTEWSYSFQGPEGMEDFSIARWSDLTDEERFVAAPTVYRRVASEFTPAFDGTARGDSVVFIDEPGGYMHAFTPRMVISLLSESTSAFAIPMYAADTKWKFNDATFNCAGRFRGDALAPDTNCGASGIEDDPQWGCTDDSQCPPLPGVPQPSPHAGPVYTTGFFLIVDLERVWDNTLRATLCGVYGGMNGLIAQGWIDPNSDFRACRTSPKWNPDLSEDQGLPMGDWCSRTNSPATPLCHDAFRAVSYGAAQAFKVREGRCGPGR
jgi:hypothetical protein